MRGKDYSERKDLSPGPGAYDANDSQMKNHSPTYKMGTSNRNSIVNKILSDMPGPGQYTQSSIFGNSASKGVTILGKEKERQHDNSPGPGGYDAKTSLTKDRVVSHKISSSVSHGEGLVSKSQRDLPGPGSYQNENVIGKGGPHYSIKGKSKEKVGNGNPGPGNYDPSSSLTKDKTVTH
jgi:hypothetical protein